MINSDNKDHSMGRATHCALLAVASSLLPAEVLDLLQPLCLVLICDRASSSSREWKNKLLFRTTPGASGGSHEEDELLWSVQQSFGDRGSHNSALGKVITCSNSHAPELNPLTTKAGKHTGLSAWSFFLPSSSPSSLSHRQSLAPASYTFYSYTIKIGKHTAGRAAGRARGCRRSDAEVW